MDQSQERLKSIDFYKNNTHYKRKGDLMKFNCAYTELVDIHKLVPNPKNNNHHPKEQIDRLAKIIDYQGQRSPIVVSNRSGFIVKGHGRLEAIRKLGWEQVAVDYQDYESEAQEYADMTADNQIAMWAEFDNNMLMSEIPELGDMDLDMLGLKELDLEKDDNKKNDIISEPECEFTQELLEEHNYVVLYFDNEVDWLQAQSLFELKTVQALGSKQGFRKMGVGRVLKGAEALEKLKKSLKEIA